MTDAHIFEAEVIGLRRVLVQYPDDFFAEYPKGTPRFDYVFDGIEAWVLVFWRYGAPLKAERAQWVDADIERQVRALLSKPK